MPVLKGKGLKALKILHFITVGFWVGGAFGLNFMLLAPGAPASGGELLGYTQACKFVDDFVVIPGAVGCLLTGLLFSLLTPWGFFKPRWVAVKWILTVFCILFGTFFLGPRINGQPPIASELGLAALADPSFTANRSGNILGGLVQLALIVFMVAISVLRPWKGAKKAA